MNRADAARTFLPGLLALAAAGCGGSGGRSEETAAPDLPVTFEVDPTTDDRNAYDWNYLDDSEQHFNVVEA